jgi:predicted DNA-binding WGR domain protein
METLLIYKDDVSNKFWKINVKGKVFTVTYGKVGSIGAVKTKVFESENLCQKEANRLIQSKLKKGYVGAALSAQVIKESTMTESLFWELVETAGKKGEDPDEQLEWLINNLTRRPVKDIVMFDYWFNQNYNKSYSSNLWAAAYIIMGGCSDDCFDYFRAWLLYQGKETYEDLMIDPEKIIPCLRDLEKEGDMPQFEDLLYVASMAYEEKTGLDEDQYYHLYEKLTGDSYLQPDIELDWDENDEEGLRKKFPKLWERYGEDPLEY